MNEVDDRGACYPLTIDPLMTTPSWSAESDQAGANFGSSSMAWEKSARALSGWPNLWKVTPRLSLNYGVYWQPALPQAFRKNTTAWSFESLFLDNLSVPPRVDAQR